MPFITICNSSHSSVGTNERAGKVDASDYIVLDQKIPHIQEAMYELFSTCTSEVIGYWLS